MIHTNNTSITVGWDKVHGATGYYLQLLHPNYTAPVYTTTVANLQATLPVSDPSVAYTITVAPVGPECNPGPVSRLSNILPIVVELIADRNAPIPEDQIEIQADGSGCFDLPWSRDPYYLDVVDYTASEGSHSFYELIMSGLYSESGSDVTLGQIVVGADDPATPSSGLRWTSYPIGLSYQNNSYAPPVVVDVINTRIRYKVRSEFCNLFDVKITAIENLSVQVCYRIALESVCDEIDGFGFKIWAPNHQMRTSQNQDPRAANQAGRHQPGHHPALAPVGLAVQNPFGASLQVFATQEPQAPCRLQLFRADGRLVLEQTAPAALKYQLPTADLPAGLYLLRVETDGHSETFKVIKGR
ncbi:MAG: T9SS type A sorting domain-containing protein [Saprospiraceae bacterium]|nr:T9SS type A sorting domain-containing protein [Saprospiraceae bacterium]